MRSPLWQWAAVAIWCAVLGLTVWASFARRDVVARSELIYAPFLSYELAPGGSAVFVVPADIQRVRLISRTTLPVAWPGRPGPRRLWRAFIAASVKKVWRETTPRIESRNSSRLSHAKQGCWVRPRSGCTHNASGVRNPTTLRGR